MLKKFWEEKKHIIQIIAVMHAIGALFLTIPVPGNEHAKIALLNIQFVWLMVITISTMILVINFWIFFFKSENSKMRVYIPDYEGSLSVIFIVIMGWLIWNLWQYVIDAYKASFFTMGKNLFPLIFSPVILFFYEINKQIFRKFESSWKKSVFISFCLCTFVVFFMSVCGMIVYQRSFLTTAARMSGMLYFVWLLIIIKKYFKNQ